MLSSLLQGRRLLLLQGSLQIVPTLSISKVEYTNYSILISFIEHKAISIHLLPVLKDSTDDAGLVNE